MNIPIIQKFFIKKKINQNNQINKSVNNQKINNIILLIDESNNENEYKYNILKQIKDFGFNNDQITLLSYYKITEKGKSYEFPIFTKNSFSLFGIVKSKQLKSILNNSYSLLINFYENDNPYLDLVAQKINADFKVGLIDASNKTNHLVVNCKLNDTNIYLSETIKYLKILNKI